MATGTLRGCMLGLAIACTAALGACGGGGSDTVSQPEPKTHIADEVADFNKAIADQDCKEYAAFAFSLTRTDTTPGAPPSAAECKGLEAPMAAVKGAKFDQSAEYGTGGLMQGTVGSQPALAIFALDRDGVYRALASVPADKQIGVSPTETTSPDKNAQAFVDAVKAGDCGKAESLLNPASPAWGGDLKAACDNLVHGKIFAPALKATDDPTASRMGASLDFAFYGVPTNDAFFTVVTASEQGSKQGPPDKIFDVVPSTDAPGIPATQK